MMAAAAGMAFFSSWPPQAIAHLALAMGILPLILAAMSYFVPVLTRSSAQAPQWLPLALLASWLGGSILITGFIQWPNWPDGKALSLGTASLLAALLAAAAALSLLLWSRQRKQRCVGQPHPGLHWYLAALTCLLLALLAIVFMPLWPAQRAALRLFHLHLNLLGFVGLTTLGTLQVLLPTSAMRPDPAAHTRLSRDLKPALAGVLLIAAGAAWWLPLAWLGTAVFLLAPLRMLKDSWLRYHDLYPKSDSLPAALYCSSLMLSILVFLGLWHGSGPLEGRATLLAWILGFLLPLVSATVSQLLPVWLRPGPQREWHKQLRAQLVWQILPRTLCMVSGGLLLAWGHLSGLALSACGALLMLIALLRSLKLLHSPTSL